MANWVVLGADGMLGREIVELLPEKAVQGFNKSQCDITDRDQIKVAITEADYVINCAAWTAVDAAEENEDTAYLINAVGAKNVAQECALNQSKMIQISTDYVFSGTQQSPIRVDEKPAPKSAYGRTKLAGENFVKEILPDDYQIVRTAWLYGKHGGNFVKTMLNLENEKETVSVVNDQFGQPTWTYDLANLVIQLGQSAPSGVYHGTSSGSTNWAEFATEIFKLKGADPARVKEVSSSEFVRPAPRPRYSVLDHSETIAVGLDPIRDWKVALHEAFAKDTFTTL